jgi:hypothetical protein
MNLKSFLFATSILSLGIINCANKAFAQTSPIQGTPNLSAIDYSQNTADNGPIIAPPKAVDEETLKEVKLWGLYEDITQGDLLPTNLWLGTDKQNIEYAFARISKDQKITPLLNLAKRALFSGGLAPEIDSDKLAITRFAIAQRLGDVNSSVNLISLLPEVSKYENMSLQYADNLLFVGKIEEACGLIAQLKPKETNKRLLELRASCFALHNESAAALLTLEVVNSLATKDKKPIDDWLSRAIIYVAANNNANTMANAANLEFNGDNGANFALSTRANLPLPNKELPNNAVTQLYLKKTNLNPPNLLAAARLGLGDYNNLAMGNPMPNIAPQINPVSGQIIQTPPNLADELVSHLLMARDLNEFYNISKIIGPKLSAVQDFSIDKVKYLAAAAIIANDKESFIRFNGLDYNEKPAFALIGAAQFGLKTPYVLENRVNSVTALSPEYHFAAFDALIAKKIGVSGSFEDFWRLNLVAKVPVAQNILLAMDEAASRKAVAETILLANIAMAGQAPNNIDNFATLRVINALKNCELENEAKEFAIFVLLGRNLPNIGETKPISAIKPIAPKTAPAKPPIKAQKPNPNDGPKWSNTID